MNLKNQEIVTLQKEIVNKNTKNDELNKKIEEYAAEI